MKRVLAIALLMCVILSGCGFGTDGTIFDILASYGSEGKVLSLTVEDSTSKFDIYPEEAQVIGKFDRVQFGNLSNLQQSIYIQLDNAIYNMETGFIEAGICSYRDLELAYYALRHDRPEYFWLPTQYTLRVVGESRMIQFAETEVDWLCTKEERGSIELSVKKILDEFYTEVASEESDFDREIKAHDWLIENIDYNFDAVEDASKYPEAWTIEGVFLKKSAVCEGYSRGMQVLMLMLGIQCGTVVGVAEEPHMWNIVKIDDNWYHLDITSDDGGENGTYYSYLNVTEEMVRKSRSIYSDFEAVGDEAVEDWQYNYKLPFCDSNTQNYFIKNGAYVTNKSQIKATVVSLVCAAVREGGNSVEIGFSADLGFDYDTVDDPDEFFNLADVLSEANEELDPEQRLSTYTWSYLENGYSLKISW